MKQKRDREEPCFTCGHYHDYEHGEPCGVCGHVMTQAEHKVHISAMPTTVIPGFLYLGSYDTASRSELLKTMNMTHILNVVPTCQALFKNTFTYHTVSSTPPDYNECFEFLDGVYKGDNKVLVYCMSGISRSPGVVIGYLMKLRQWRLAESYKWVKEKRPSIKLTPDEQQRLMDLEVQLHKSCSVPLGFASLDMPGLTAASVLSAGPAQQQPQQHITPAHDIFGVGRTSFTPQSSSPGTFVFGSSPNQPQGAAAPSPLPQAQLFGSSSHNDMES